MKIWTLGLAAALALACAPVAAQPPASIALKAADGSTVQEGGATDTGGRFYPGHLVFGWTGSALKAAAVDATTGDLKVICDSGCSGSGGSGGAVTQSGTWSVGLTGTLPGFATPPTFNFGSLNGAATAAGQASILTALGSPLQADGTVAVSNLPATQPVSAASLPLPAGAATSAAQATANSSLSTIATNTSGLALHSDALAIIAALGTPLQAGGSVAVSNFPGTQPVSAAALPLPAGAATSAKQDALLTAVGALLQPGGSVSVSNLPTTQAISAVALPLPAGAATASGVAAVVTALGSPLQAGGAVTVGGVATSANQTTGNAALNTLATGALSKVDGSGYLYVTVTNPSSGGGGASSVTATSSGAITNPTSSLGLPSATTAYSAGQLVANSTTAGSVVTPSFAIANTAGGALIPRLRLSTNDATTSGWAGTIVQVDLWSAAPTFTGGDRTAFAVATGTANHLASYTGTMSAVYGDGAYAELAPVVGSSPTIKLAAGTAVYWTLQVVSLTGATGASKTFTLTAELSN